MAISKYYLIPPLPEGLERLSPLADVAVGGLLVGTVLTLIYIPMFAYSVESKNVSKTTL